MTVRRWPEVRIRFVTRLNPSKSEVSGLPRETEVTFLPMDAIGDDGSIRLDATRSLAVVDQGYTYFRDGDVAIAKITPCFENGKGALMSGLLGGVGFGTTELIVVRPDHRRITGSFLQWLFTSPHFRNAAEAAMYGAGGQKRVPDDFVRDFAILLPTLAEQSAITAFLDREASKIDALVAEQERLIALLKEKRQAVISHAVTKGLNPNAPIKDSGVPWLGVVPAQWRVIRLKFAVGSSAAGIQIGPFGGMLTDLPSNPTGLKLYGQQNIISGDFDAGDRWISEHTFNSNSAYHINSGDLLVTRKGSLGNCRIVPDSVRPGWFDSDSICIRVNHQTLNNEYLQLALHEAPYVAKQIDETRRGAILSGINSEVIANLVLVLPCLEIQLEILAFLYEKRRGFDNLISEATRAITLLRERRAALISAAVTGKIDVRDTMPATRDAA